MTEKLTQEMAAPQAAPASVPAAAPATLQDSPGYLDDIFAQLDFNEAPEPPLTPAPAPYAETHYAEPMAQQTRIDIRPAPSGDFEFSPNIWRLARLYTMCDIIPQQLRTSKTGENKAANVYLVLATGKAFGIPSAAVALQSFYIINGAITMRTKMKLSLVQHAKGKVEISYDEKAVAWTCSITRHDNGVKTTMTFGLQDAVTLGKMVQDPRTGGYVGLPGTSWEGSWKKMLLTRAVAMCCDMAYADLMMGLPATETMDDWNPPAVQLKVNAEPPAFPAAEIKAPSQDKLKTLLQK